MVPRGDPNRAGGLVAKLAQAGKLGPDLVEARPDRPQQALSGLGRRDASGRTREQPHADALLERADRVTEGRGRDAELGGGAGEAALSGNGQERDKVGHRLAQHY